MGKCEISSKNKKCISCRYDRCSLVGMDPMLVQVTKIKEEPLQESRRKSGKNIPEDKPGEAIDRFDNTFNLDIPKNKF